jgi:hypothetical protein
MPGQTAWLEALRLHESAAAGLARSAEAIPPQAWAAPMAEGKWSPAQITEHLILAYEVLLRELEGGPGMQLRTRGWQRLLLRFTLVPRILRGDTFPTGARAPRETRPGEVVGEQADQIARFRADAERFHAAVQEARASNPRQQLTHAYFGASSLEESVLLCARHIQHHHKQLPASPGDAGGA